VTATAMDQLAMQSLRPEDALNAIGVRAWLRTMSHRSEEVRT